MTLRMKSNGSVVAIIMGYLVVYFYVLLKNPDAAILYLCCLPLCAVPLIISVQSGKAALSTFYILIFFSLGLNSFIFFLEGERYLPWGNMSAIGDFDFQLAEYLIYFFKIYIFSSSVIIFYRFLYRTREKKGIAAVFPKMKECKKYDYLCIALCIFSSALSAWMFERKIGITGLIPPRLPFHLSGILYYFRLYIITVIILFFYFKSKKSMAAAVAILTYAYIGGITSLSKGIPSMLLMPIMAEMLVYKKNGRLVITGIWYCVLYYIVQNSRGLIYSDIYASYRFLEMMWYSAGTLQAVHFNIVHLIISCIDRISDRQYGGQTLVITSQYHKLSFYDLLLYYSGKPLSNIIPDMAGEMFRMRLNGSMATGVGIGMLGTVNVLANGSLPRMIVQGFVIAVLLVFLDKSMDRIIKAAVRNEVKLISLIAVFGMVAALYLQMFPLRFLYILIIFFYVVGCCMRGCSESVYSISNVSKCTIFRSADCS